MTSPGKLPALPMRSVSVPLPDSMIDALDEIRRIQEGDVPSRSVLIREALALYLELHMMPSQLSGAILDMIETARTVLAGDDETPADVIGEPKGTA